MTSKLDKLTNDVYIWYSGATDITGKKLVEALGCSGGRNKPIKPDYKLVVGWGAKTNKDVSIKADALNHPNNIKSNRNKFKSLQVMRAGNVSVAPFTDDINTVAAGTVQLPVIGRTNYHQGGKGFWTCPTMTHVIEAGQAGASYFQEMIEIKDEYRLHVFDGKVIYAVKKVKRTKGEMEEAFIKHEMDRQKSLAEKNGNPFDEATAELFLRRQAKKFAQDGANMLIRSNRLGWRFSKVKNVDSSLEEEAAKALSALGLTFGAVDCCMDVNGEPYIIEVNTGPGLEGSTLEAWVAAFKEKIESILQPPKKETTTTKRVLKSTAKKSRSTSSAGGKKSLIDKLKMAQEMVESADEDEAEILTRVFGRMFS